MVARKYDWEQLAQEFVLNQHYTSMREWLLKEKQFSATRIKSKAAIKSINEGNRRRKELKAEKLREFEKVIDENTKIVHQKIRQAKNSLLQKLSAIIENDHLSVKEMRDAHDMIRKELGEANNIVSFQDQSSKIAEQFDTLIGNMDVSDTE